jgi:adenine-specific DNA-methyltransferase
MDNNKKDLRERLFNLVPADGGAVGNKSLFEAWQQQAAAQGHSVTEALFNDLKEQLHTEGRLLKGRGRGGSVMRATADRDFSLHTQAAPEPEPASPKAGRKTKPTAGGKKSDHPEVMSYRHSDKRKNNPEVGMVKPENDPDEGTTRWCYDPHIDPALQFDYGRAQVEKIIDDALASGDDATMRTALEELKRYSAPYLNWTGKAERTTFDVETVSLHVHERIDPASILSAIRKNVGRVSPQGRNPPDAYQHQPDLFAAPFENLPLRDAIDFYKHERGWANRLIAGDSLLVMNSLLQKESLAGQVQMIYIDPPYGIKYGSNFQPFVNKRDVKDRKDEDLTQEPEMIKAFRDTWELGIHSYLTYLRDRLLLAKELLHESGSVFVQISDENLHLVRNVLDEVFGAENFTALITYSTTGGFAAATLSRTGDYVLWYAKTLAKVKFRRLFLSKNIEDAVRDDYDQLELWSGERRAMSPAEKRDPAPLGDIGRPFTDDNPTSQGEGAATGDFVYRGMTFHPGAGNHWKAPLPHGMRRLAQSVRLQITPKGKLRYVRYFADFDQKPVTNAWFDIAGSVQDRSDPKVYVVQTSNKIIERCLLMTTDPGDLVLDPTCGSGTTAFVAEKWGRRWITTDTSRVAVTLAKQRLMTASYDYYELKYPQEGLKGGFIYKTVPHVTLKSIANNPEINEIYARTHPAIEAALAELNSALHPSPAGGRGAGGEGARTAYIPNPPARIPESLLRHAREMRKGATDAEILLWQLLRDRQVGGAKFRRQHPIGKFITDFYCDEHRLVIELDGGQHAGQKAYDEERTAFLEQQGLKVLRFWNNQVLNETDGVLQVIWEHVGGGETLTPTPLPPAGEGHDCPMPSFLLRRVLSLAPKTPGEPGA